MRCPLAEDLGICDHALGLDFAQSILDVVGRFDYPSTDSDIDQAELAGSASTLTLAYFSMSLLFFQSIRSLHIKH